MYVCVQLERLQIENAEEWTRREQLETEKIVLERENKKLRADLDLVQEELDRKTQQMSTALDGDLRTLQSEMIERTKVIKYLCLRLAKIIAMRLLWRFICKRTYYWMKKAYNIFISTTKTVVVKTKRTFKLN